MLRQGDALWWMLEVEIEKNRGLKAALPKSRIENVENRFVLAGLVEAGFRPLWLVLPGYKKRGLKTFQDSEKYSVRLVTIIYK